MAQLAETSQHYLGDVHEVPKGPVFADLLRSPQLSPGARLIHVLAAAKSRGSQALNPGWGRLLGVTARQARTYIKELVSQGIMQRVSPLGQPGYYFLLVHGVRDFFTKESGVAMIRPYCRVSIAPLVDKKLTMVARLVYSILVSYRTRDGGLAWPSVGRIAEDAGCSVRTIQRSLRSLEVAGYVRIAGQKPKGNLIYSVFDFSLTKCGLGSECHPPKHEPRQSLSQKTSNLGSECHPSSPEKKVFKNPELVGHFGGNGQESKTPLRLLGEGSRTGPVGNGAIINRPLSKTGSVAGCEVPKVSRSRPPWWYGYVDRGQGEVYGFRPDEGGARD